MRHTTLLLALAALAATSCSLQLDSQYGLRWDRRVPVLRNDEDAGSPHVDDVNPQWPTQKETDITEASTLGQSQSNEATIHEFELLEPRQDFHVSPREISTEMSQATSEPTIENRLALPQKASDLEPNIGQFILKSFATIALIGAAGFLLLIGFIVAAFTDWSGTSNGGGSGGGGVGIDLGGDIPLGNGLFGVLVTGLGIFFCIKLIKRIWKKSPRS